MTSSSPDHIQISVKWGKQTFSNVNIDRNDSLSSLNNCLFALTNVPPQRQKLMSKSWKGILKDTEQLQSIAPNATIILMGSAETVEKPKDSIIFMEDVHVKPEDAVSALYPAGLSNLGNTCFMNSTMQCLRPVTELLEALDCHSGRVDMEEMEERVTVATQTLYKGLKESVGALTPFHFVRAMREAYPQFAQMAPRSGEFMQQDSEEFLSTLLSTLSRTLAAPQTNAKNMIDALFSLELEETLTCLEETMESSITKVENALKLVCNITIDTNHLTDGIKIGLEGTIEKHSAILNRDAMWKKVIRINRLPKYLCVQFMRFYWKLTPNSRDHTGVKCKMLRPISYPQMLDVYEFCTPKLQSALEIGRQKNADKILNEFKTTQDSEENAELEAAKALSLGIDSVGLHLPNFFQGNYELFAILTHKGRSADSGHYMAWVHDRDDDWFCYDDDHVSPCKTEDIQRLKGGGDWHMAYLAFYRAKC